MTREQQSICGRGRCAPTRPTNGGSDHGLTVVNGIAIIAILVIAAILFWPTRSYRPRSAMGSRGDCKSNLRQIGLALELYTNEYGQNKYFPLGGDFQLLNPLFTLGSRPILKDQFDLIICPERNSPRPDSIPIRPDHTDYLLKFGGSKTESAILVTFTADEPIGIDKPGNHLGEDGKEDSVNILFMDMHVETVIGPEEIAEWRRRVMTSGPTSKVSGARH